MDTSLQFHNALQRHKGHPLALQLSDGQTHTGMVVGFRIAQEGDAPNRYHCWQIVPEQDAQGLGLDAWGLESGHWVEHAAIVKVEFLNDHETLVFQPRTS